MHIKFHEKREHAKPKISRWKEITKIRAEINEVQAKKTIQKLMKQTALQKDRKD
jgi:hypothetical protein